MTTVSKYAPETSKTETARKNIAKYRKLIRKEKHKLHTRHCWHRDGKQKKGTKRSKYSCCGNQCNAIKYVVKRK